MKKTPFFILPFCLAILIGVISHPGYVLAQEGSSSSSGAKRFETALADSLKRLNATQTKSLFRFRAMNESVRKTASAIEMLSGRQDAGEAEALLRSALKDFKENALAELVLADILDRQARYRESNEHYIAFLKKIGLHSSFNRQILPPENRRILAEHIRQKLLERGMTPSRLDRAAPTPLLERLRTEEQSFLLQAISVGLPITLLVFTLFLIFTYVMSGGDAARSARYRVIVKLYAVFASCYVFWILRLLVQLPPLIGRAEDEVLILLGVGILAVGTFEVVSRYLSKRKEVLDPAFMRCPGCKKPIPKLSAVCPVCGRNL